MNHKTTSSYSVRHKFLTAAGMLRKESGTLLDVGSRDRSLQKFLDNPQLRYESADIWAGHDYQIDLEHPLPFADKCFDHVVALDARSVVIALPNLASLRHGLCFLVHGRLGTDKYELLPDASRDRHRWLTIYRQINRFVAEQARKHQFELRSHFTEAETGVLKILAAVSLRLGFYCGGLLSARSLSGLVRNGSGTSVPTTPDLQSLAG